MDDKPMPRITGGWRWSINVDTDPFDDEFHVNITGLISRDEAAALVKTRLFEDTELSEEYSNGLKNPSMKVGVWAKRLLELALEGAMAGIPDSEKQS